MPQQQFLQHVQEQLASLNKEVEDLSKSKYTAKDIQHLQNKVHHIDEKYREGIIDDRDKKNLDDDPYEHKGQAEIAESLARIHDTLHNLLDKA